jgi:hypothetical protein
MRLQIYERLRKADRKLQYFWYKMGWEINAGTSFRWIFLILFFILL